MDKSKHLPSNHRSVKILHIRSIWSRMRPQLSRKTIHCVTIGTNCPVTDYLPSMMQRTTKICAWFPLTTFHSNFPWETVRTVNIRTSGGIGNDKQIDTLSQDYRWILDLESKYWSSRSHFPAIECALCLRYRWNNLKITHCTVSNDDW